MVQVKIFYAHNDLRNFSYLMTEGDSGKCWVIDPFDEKPILEYIKKESLTLEGILNTHHHWDHVKGNSALQSQCGCPIHSKADGPIALPDHQVLKFLETPGHSPDHVAFSWQRGEEVLALFSGDTLFNSGVGNCKGAGGNLEELYTTTNQLKKFPDQTIIYPGHDYILKNLMFAKSCEPENKEIDEALKYVRETDTSEGIQWTLGQEKKVNPFLRLDSQEINEKVMGDLNHDQKNLFFKLRSLRDNW